MSISRRNFLKGAIDPALVKQAYIPDIAGRERRKRAPSKEGQLGVEGMKPEASSSPSASSTTTRTSPATAPPTTGT